MVLKLSHKQKLVTEVQGLAKKALSVMALDYRGMTAQQITGLRSEARAAKVHLQIVRNTLAIRAFEGTEFECMNEKLKGPSLFAFSSVELSAGPRLIKGFIKTNDILKVKGMALNSQLYGPEHLDAIAKLPTRDEALSILMAVMKAPIAKLVQTLNAVPQKLVRTVDAVKSQKEIGN